MGSPIDLRRKILVKKKPAQSWNWLGFFCSLVPHGKAQSQHSSSWGSLFLQLSLNWTVEETKTKAEPGENNLLLWAN